MRVKWLREKGILKAQKKQDRETNDVISFYNHETSVNSFSLCKIKCETDLLQNDISYHLLIY